MYVYVLFERNPVMNIFFFQMLQIIFSFIY